LFAILQANNGEPHSETTVFVVLFVLFSEERNIFTNERSEGENTLNMILI